MTIQQNLIALYATSTSCRDDTLYRQMPPDLSAG
jgi:hypothetical protein